MAEKSIEKTYQKKTQIEHVLHRPDTYVGSCEKDTQTMWVYDSSSERFVERKISYTPALYKIFDEIIVNAADNIQRDRRTTQIKVDIDQKNNRISVQNNGKGIPIEMHREHNCYVPELVFGHLLTSSNYDDSVKKVTGGRNGFGAKLTNIFSKLFIVRTGDSKKKKEYYQEFKNNLSQICPPKITPFDEGYDDYTEIIFEPDLKRFHMNSLDNDTVALLQKRVYDLAGCTNTKVSVYLNGKKISKVNGFETYVNMYFRNPDEVQKVYERCSDRWEICIIPRDQDQFQQVSFVNQICTVRGGTHVNHVVDKIQSNIMEQIKKKHKKLEVKPYQIRNSLWVFINCLIENPCFDSQTKETLTSKPNTFGSQCEISDKTLKKVLQSGVVDQIVMAANFKEEAKLKKGLGTGGKKKSKLYGIPKLEDANWAGTEKSRECTLILTEGDSAKSLAMSGLQIVGRDKFGVFPLRGKFLNVRDASTKQILENEEVQSLIKIMGLFVGRNYQDEGLHSLRYGSIMIMTDQDHDGSHIKGLLINFIHHFWPSLIKIKGFLREFVTPIIKVNKGTTSLSFFTISEYEKWAKQQNNIKSFKIKYYKGLGTSTSVEAKEYFKQIERHRIYFQYGGHIDDDKINLAFSKKLADDRKQWLSHYNPNIYVDHNNKELKYSEFIDRELIHFSVADNLRSIPCLIDGLKPGQRKILYACFKRNLKNEIKVAQLAGYVAEHSAYHHGEMSLCSTIVNMAQDFVGSNNVNVLLPIGQFGSRMQGGKEAASARYIFTNLNPLTRVLFNENDDPILNYQIEEGQKIEPDFYVPIIPMSLVNGAEGIGTGWSTSVPSFSPLEIIDNLRKRLQNPLMKFYRMTPWYKGFKGIIEPKDSDRSVYVVKGRYSVREGKLEITELPVMKWIRDYKNMLEEMAQKDEITDIKEYHKDNKVHFVLKVPDIHQLSDEAIEKKFKLTMQISCNNLVLFDSNYNIRRFNNEIEIMEEFFRYRYNVYDKRKEYMMKKLTQECTRLKNQSRFINEIITGELKIFNKKKSIIVDILKAEGYKSWNEIYREKDEKEILLINENNNDEQMNQSSYDYLLGLNMFTFTQEKLEELTTKTNQKEQELTKLQKATIEELWLNDLDEFERLYKEELEDDDIRYYEQNRKKQKEYLMTGIRDHDLAEVTPQMPKSEHRKITQNNESSNAKDTTEELKTSSSAVRTVQIKNNVDTAIKDISEKQPQHSKNRETYSPIKAKESKQDKEEVKQKSSPKKVSNRNEKFEDISSKRNDRSTDKKKTFANGKSSEGNKRSTAKKRKREESDSDSFISSDESCKSDDSFSLADGERDTKKRKIQPKKQPRKKTTKDYLPSSSESASASESESDFSHEVIKPAKSRTRGQVTTNSEPKINSQNSNKKVLKKIEEKTDQKIAKADKNTYQSNAEPPSKSKKNNKENTQASIASFFKKNDVSTTPVKKPNQTDLKPKSSEQKELPPTLLERMNLTPSQKEILNKNHIQKSDEDRELLHNMNNKKLVESDIEVLELSPGDISVKKVNNIIEDDEDDMIQKPKRRILDDDL